VRPEKIRLLEEAAAGDPRAEQESGTVAEVVYVGMVTRFIVELDAGGTLTVVRQNLETSASALELRGRRVRLEWRPEQTFAIEATSPQEKREDT